MKVNFKTYNKKIDLYTKNLRGNWVYKCSTMAHSTCKQAKTSLCNRHNLDKSQVKAVYSN